MRQSKAKGIAFGTGALILAAVALFAVLQQADSAVAIAGVASEGSATDAGTAGGGVERASEGAAEQAGREASRAREEASQVPDSILAAGREVYEEQSCSVCHSIAGEGSPRSPLDGVGSRLDADEIRLWIVNPQEARPGVRKPAFDDVPDAEVDALVAYLQSLTDE